MCAMSMVMQHQFEIWDDRYRTSNPLRNYGPPFPTGREIEEFHKLFNKAREYDKKNNEPECEMEEKKELLLELAEKLGVDISFIDEDSQEED